MIHHEAGLKALNMFYRAYSRIPAKNLAYMIESV